MGKMWRIFHKWFGWQYVYAYIEFSALRERGHGQIVRVRTLPNGVRYIRLLGQTAYLDEPWVEWSSKNLRWEELP